MSEFVLNEIRHGFYLDSVALMRMSREIAGLPGVSEAAMMMGTPANKEIMHDAGLLDESGAAAEANDRIIGIRASTEDAARHALASAGHHLEKPRSRVDGEDTWRPRSLRAALSAMPDANLALISVPGDYATAEARKALRRGLHVMIFSDNVSLAGERELKEEARELGRLVMGPDCGTAILNGVPLAFANRVPRGDIAIIGASGTGTQEISCLIAQAGRGISQAIGVGGRDLKEEIGGITTLMAFDMLDADPATNHIVLVSKPPHPDVAKRIVERIAKSEKRVVACFLGSDQLDLPANAQFAATLKDAADFALGRPRKPVEQTAPPDRRTGRIVGLYAGGTLAAEAQIVLAAGGRNVASNAPVPGSAPMSSPVGEKDVIFDLGDDEYTRGRPHPMIDPAVREDVLLEFLGESTVGAILLDVVIGYGAHSDPAAHLASTLGDRPVEGPPIVASVTGTEEDPQVRSRQVATLRNAGIVVAPSNAEAAALALAICRESEEGG